MLDLNAGLKFIVLMALKGAGVSWTNTHYMLTT